MNTVRLMIAGLLLCSLTSCRVVRVYVGVAQARNDYSHGEYQQANRRLIALEESSPYTPWISYNLGTIYYALGEPAAAAEIWEQASGNVNRDLAFRTEFNLGVLAYDRGDYDEAYQRFRAALKLDPTSIEAKQNLEIVLNQMEDDRRQERTDGTGETTSPETDSDVRRLLQYVERLEKGVWWSTERIEPEEGVQDW